ncbi:MAG: hypothetical protein ACE14L_06410 [Terriglobales bacterium]
MIVRGPERKVYTMRQAMDALEWARKEIVRVNAPDQFRNGIRERRVQQLCKELLRQRRR